MGSRGGFKYSVENFKDRMNIFKELDLDYFTIEKTGEENYKSLYYLFQGKIYMSPFLFFLFSFVKQRMYCTVCAKYTF